MILGGCEYKKNIEIHEDIYRKIEIGQEYRLNQGHSYDIEYTEGGMSITLYFIKEEVQDGENNSI